MNLENLGVQEMNTQELKQVEGGWVRLLYMYALDVANNLDDHVKAARDGWNKR